MLRVAEQAFRTDTGRQRVANEDAFYARAPLFAVADGMGGAQAGEVASRIAADSFEPAERRDQSPEAYLRSIAEAANARIHDLAESDESRSGMGTTLTAAIVEGEEVSFAHVGDSRAYLYRDGDLKLLTSDHSLVEELRRQGRLTADEASEHPQRSIITRALGPEEEVEVDTMTYRGRPDDVYLLCSDGLTSMVRDERMAEVLADSETLDAAVTRLVRDANEAGGRDNITVVAFRLEDALEGAEAVEDATLVGPTAAEAGVSAERIRTAARPRAARRPAGPPRRSRLRMALKVLVASLVLAGVFVGAVIGARQVYFLGADEGGRLTLYRGLPYELPLDLNLYSEIQSIPIQVDSLPADRRDEAIDHELRGRTDAIDLLEDLESAATTISPSQPSGGPQGGDRGDGAAGGGGTGGRREAGDSSNGTSISRGRAPRRNTRRKSQATPGDTDGPRRPERSR